jgi:hypothetical protein
VRSPALGAAISLLPADNALLVWAVLLAGAAFAAWAEQTRWGRRVSGVLVAILLAMVLSNLRLIPLASPSYDSALAWLIPVAIPLLLFDANLRRIFRETGRMLLAFGIGTVGTILGVLLGVQLIPLGDTAGELAGVFSATYIGGGLNFVAVAQAASPPTTWSPRSTSSRSWRCPRWPGSAGGSPRRSLTGRRPSSARRWSIATNRPWCRSTSSGSAWP